MRAVQKVLGVGLALGLTVVAAGCGSSGAASGGGPANGIGSPTTLPQGPTLNGLTSSVKSQIVGTGSSDFSVTGVDKVICSGSRGRSNTALSS